MQVLLTRPQAAAEASARRLGEHGHTAILLPLLEYSFMEAAAPGEKFDALVFTSAAAPAFLRQCQRASVLPANAFCAGDATAAAARAAGFEPEMAPYPGARGIVALVRSHIALGRLPAHPRLLYASGRDISLELDRSLPQAKIARMEIYEARLLDPGGQRLNEAVNAADAVLLYSPRSAGHFIDLCKKYCLEADLARLTVVGISEKVVDMIPNQLKRQTIAARIPEERAMIAALHASQAGDNVSAAGLEK